MREDRFANTPMGGGFGGRGGFGARGAFGGGFGGRGGFGGGRGGFGGGYGGGRGGYGGAPGGVPGGGYDASPAMPAAAPNPFTDYATSGTEKNETIYVRNVSDARMQQPPVDLRVLLSD